MANKAKEPKVPNGEPDPSSTGESLSKASPRPRRRSKNDGKDPAAGTGTPLIGVDSSNQRVVLTSGAPIFGAKDTDLTKALLQQVHNVTSIGKSDLQELKWVLATVQDIAPRNALEGLLAAQMIGVHSLAMECLSRAAVKEQTTERIDANVHRAVRLLRTFTSQMEALNRNRGKISQQMVVGSVNVNEGGQAIVGSVEHRGNGKASGEEDAKKGK